MAEGKAGRPRVLHRRLVRDATEDERDHEKAILKAKSDTSIIKAALKATLTRAPDLFLLGGGFFLGHTMNMRPGLTLPGGVFIGFPDFGGAIDALQKVVDTAKSEIEKEEKNLVRNDEEEAACIARAKESFLRHRDTFRLAADTVRCQERNVSKELRKKLARNQAELQKHKIAQGILMATLVFAFTRSGFLQGIGEIIPG